MDNDGDDGVCALVGFGSDQPPPSDKRKPITRTAGHINRVVMAHGSCQCGESSVNHSTISPPSTICRLRNQSNSQPTATWHGRMWLGHHFGFESTFAVPCVAHHSDHITFSPSRVSPPQDMASERAVWTEEGRCSSFTHTHTHI